MHLFNTEGRWSGRKWIKVISIVGKSFLGVVIAGTFILFSIMIYLIIQDYFYNEGEDDFNENGHETMHVDQWDIDKEVNV